MPVNNPTIVVPGIKGSSLENFFSLTPTATWSEWGALSTAVLGPDLASLALDSSARFDRSPDVTSRPNGLLPAAYQSLVSALRQRRRLPVYVFPYDWRYSVEGLGAELARFVAMVRAKVGAMAKGWSGQVDFVVHSLGGLVFRSFLAQAGAPASVGQVVFMAVPHRGALDAVEAMTRGESTLLAGRKEMRKLARTFPGVYELLPRFAGAVIANGQPLDVFELSSWQDNVHAQGFAGADASGFDVDQKHLDAARGVLTSLADPVQALAPGNLLTIYGARSNSTLEQVQVRPQAPFTRWYDFDGATHGTGDGVVLERSALLPRVPAVRLEWGDVSFFSETAAATLSFHAFIATLDETQSIVARFLDGSRGAAALLPHGLPSSRYLDSPPAQP